MGWQDAPEADQAVPPAKPSWANAPEVAPQAPAADNLGVYPVPPPPPTGDSLRASWQAVQPVNADEQGRVLRIARDSGVPPQVVAADPQGFAQAAPTHLDTIASHSPTLAAHVQDPANMAAAKDDLAKLSTLEWTLTGGLVSGATADEPLRAQPPVWIEALRKGWAGVRQGLEKTRQQLGLDPAWTQILYPLARTALTEEARAEQAAPDVVAAARDLQAKGLAARMWVGGFQAVPFLAGNAVAAGVGGFPGMLAFNTASVYGENVEAIEQIQGPSGEGGASPGGRALAAVISGGEGVLYSFGLGKFGRTVAGPIAKRIPGEILDRVMSSTSIPKAIANTVVRFGVAEAEGAGTMAAADALAAAGMEYARSRVDETHEFDTAPIVDRAVQTFEAGLTDFALISAIGAGRSFLHDLGTSRASAREAQALRDAAAAVKDSKLAERDPQAVAELVDRANPGQSVLVDREFWDNYWKGKNTDPRGKATEIAGDGGRAYDTAGGTQYLALPLGQYLTKLGKTEHMLGLAADTKLSAESRTPREEGVFQIKQAKRDEEAKRVRGAQIEADKATVAKTVEESAIGAGVPKEEAAAVGALVAESAGTVALKTGLDVKAATVMMGLGRFRFLGPKAVEVAQAAHEKLKAQLTPALRENIAAAERGDRRAQMRLATAAYLEPMTGLLNRTAFEDYRVNRTAGGWDVAIDANDLKAQDILGGHEVGDAMLKNIAEAMRRANEGGQARLFRHGGDEFHAGGFTSEQEARAFAQRLGETLQTMPEVAKGFRVSAAMGIGPDIAAADLATYEAKKAKTEKVGAYTKGQPLPEKLGAGESFTSTRKQPAAPKGETPIAVVGPKTVTTKLEQGGQGQPRGLVRMQIDALGRPVDFPVQLLAGDASTAFHELGHFLSWAMHDVAMDQRGTTTRGDYYQLLKWAGYASPEERLHANLERADLEAKATRTPAEDSRLKALRAKEERIGHGFEQYLAEGVAPSRALTRVFANLREWMLKVYRGIFGIAEQYRQVYGQDLQVSDEIRGVFDRWLSADQTVGRVEADAGSGEAMGRLLGALDPKDREALIEAEADRVDATSGEVYQTLKQDEQGPKESVRAKLRDEVAAEIDAEPVRRLQAYLSREKRPEAGIVEAALGQIDPSLLDEHGQPFRLDRKSMVDDYGPEIVKELPRGATVPEGGIEADFLAERFGYDSADAMVKALRKAGPRDAAVEAKLQERLLERYPAVAENPQGVVQSAIDAEHSPKAAEAALEAARILVREVDPGLALRLKMMPEQAKAAAKRLIDETRIADVQPERFLAAERKYRREALELTTKAIGKGEERAKEFAAQAMDAWEKALLNMEEYRAARDAKAEMRKAAAYAQRMTTDEARREIGKATSAETDADGKVWVTQPYLDRMDDLTESIDFRKGSGNARRSERFSAWLEQQTPDTRTDVLSRVSTSTIADLNKARHWTNLTVQEMRDLTGAMETIEAQAKLKSKLRTTQGERDKEQFVARLVQELQQRFPRGAGVARFEEAQPLGRRIIQGGRKAKATLDRPEAIYRELGPAASEIFRTMSVAEVEANRLIRETGLPIVKQIEALPAKERKLLRQTFEIDGERFTGEQIIAIALNWGNESNRSKMLRGELALADKFRLARPISEETFRKAMTHLSDKGIDLVNTIHRQVGEAHWDEIAALEKEFTGLAPPKVEAAPWTLDRPDGTKAEVQGGYYPVAYDGRFSTAGAHAGEQVSQGVGALAFSPTYERAASPQGHLQARIESFARPLDLSLSALPRAIVNHMRDLAMRRALVQTREILTDPRVRDAIQEAMGTDAYRTLTDHWRDTANEYASTKGQPDWLLRWSQRRRSAVTAAVFAGNVSQAIQNFANPIAAMTQVPAGLLAKAFGKFAVERLDMRDRVLELSPYMAERFAPPSAKGAIQRAAAEVVGRQGRVASATEKIAQAGMWMMETTDMATAIPVWWAAYEQAQRPKGEGARGLAEAGSRATGLGMTPEQAIAHADEVVRLTQSSYRWMDKSAFERHPVFRHFSMFYGYMNAQLGQFITAHADRRLLADEGFKTEALRRVVKSYALLMASGVAADLFVGKGPQDYDGDGEITAEDWAKWTALRAVLYPPSTLPVVGGYLQQLGEPGGTVRDPSLVPATRVAQVGIRALQHAQQAASPDAKGNEAYKAGLEALEAVGWYYGLPVVQVKRTGDYFFDITPDGQVVESQEAQQAEGLLQPFLGATFGPTKPGRLTEAVK